MQALLPGPELAIRESPAASRAIAPRKGVTTNAIYTDVKAACLSISSTLSGMPLPVVNGYLQVLQKLHDCIKANKVMSLVEGCILLFAVLYFRITHLFFFKGNAFPDRPSSGEEGAEIEQTAVPSRPTSLFSEPRRNRQQSGTTLTILSPVGQPLISIFSPTNGPSIVTLHSQETRDDAGTLASVGTSTINAQQLLDLLQPSQTETVPRSNEASFEQPLLSPVASTSNALLIGNRDRPSPIASASILPRAVIVNATVPPESNEAVAVSGSNQAAMAPRKRGRPPKQPPIQPPNQNVPSQQATVVSSDANLPAAPTQATRKRKSDISLEELAGFPPTKRRVGRPRMKRNPSKWSASNKSYVKKPQKEKNLSKPA